MTKDLTQTLINASENVNEAINQLVAYEEDLPLVSPNRSLLDEILQRLQDTNKQLAEIREFYKI